MRKLYLLLFLCLFSAIAYGGKDLTEKWRNVDYFDNYYFTGLSCADSMNCIVTGNLYSSDGPVFRRTTDGGLSWHTIWADSSIFYFDSLNVPHYKYRPKFQVYSISFPSKDLCLAGFSRGKMLRSTNMGLSWDSIFFNTKSIIKNISMFDNNFGISQCDSNINITYNGGQTWKTTQLPDSNAKRRINEIFTPSFGNIIVSSSAGVIGSTKYYLYKSTNDGTTWEKFQLDTNINHIYFLNDSLVWGCGGYVISDTIQHKTYKFGRIYNSTNGGRTWNLQLDLDKSSIVNNDLFYSICFRDSMNGIATNVNDIYRTYNGGKTWIKQTDGIKSGDSELETSILYTSFKNNNAIITGMLVKIYKYFEEPTDVNAQEIKSNYSVITPNPVTDFLQISGIDPMLKKGVDKIEIYDILGVLYTPPNPLLIEGEQLRVDVSALLPDVYFVKIGDKVRKFVKI